MIIPPNLIESAAKAMHLKRWPEGRWDGRGTNRLYWRNRAQSALEQYAIAADPDPAILQQLIESGRAEVKR